MICCCFDYYMGSHTSREPFLGSVSPQGMHSAYWSLEHSVLDGLVRAHTWLEIHLACFTQDS